MELINRQPFDDFPLAHGVLRTNSVRIHSNGGYIVVSDCLRCVIKSKKGFIVRDKILKMNLTV